MFLNDLPAADAVARVAVLIFHWAIHQRYTQTFRSKTPYERYVMLNFLQVYLFLSLLSPALLLIFPTSSTFA